MTYHSKSCDHTHQRTHQHEVSVESDKLWSEVFACVVDGEVLLTGQRRTDLITCQHHGSTSSCSGSTAHTQTVCQHQIYLNAQALLLIPRPFASIRLSKRSDYTAYTQTSKLAFAPQKPDLQLALCHLFQQNQLTSR